MWRKKAQLKFSLAFAFNNCTVKKKQKCCIFICWNCSVTSWASCPHSLPLSPSLSFSLSLSECIRSPARQIKLQPYCAQYAAAFCSCLFVHLFNCLLVRLPFSLRPSLSVSLFAFAFGLLCLSSYLLTVFVCALITPAKVKFQWVTFCRMLIAWNLQCFTGYLGRGIEGEN